MWLKVCGSWHRSSQYPVILKAFFDALNKETDPRAVDNICAAVCRMIMAKTDAVPLEQVITYTGLTMVQMLYMLYLWPDDIF